MLCHNIKPELPFEMESVRHVNSVLNVCMDFCVFYRCVSSETQRGVCEGRGDGFAALSSHGAPAEPDLDQSHPPRGGTGPDQGHVLGRSRGDRPAGSWEESGGSQRFYQPPGELLLFSGVKYKTQTTFLSRGQQFQIKAVNDIHSTANTFVFSLSSTSYLFWDASCKCGRDEMFHESHDQLFLTGREAGGSGSG